VGDIQSLFSKSIQKKSTPVADGYGFLCVKNDLAVTHLTGINFMAGDSYLQCG
jgi:hypothetical protein